MKDSCSWCGSTIDRSPSTLFVRGAKNNFCDQNCLALYRSGQVGPDAHAYKHGGKGTRLYRIWKGIKTRCYNSRSPNFKWYGNRGISMWPEWADDFVIFREWCLANGYSEKLEIDRIDNNGNYCPANCRFVTKSANRRNSPTFKRTAETLRAITAMVAAGMSYPRVAVALGISKSTVFRAVKGEWKFEEIKP